MDDRDRTDELIAQQDRDEAAYMERSRINKDIPQSVDRHQFSRRAIFELALDDPILYAVTSKHMLQHESRSSDWDEAMREAVVHLVHQRDQIADRLSDELKKRTT